MDTLAASLQDAAEGIVGGTADPDNFPNMTPTEEVAETLRDARAWKVRMEAEGLTVG